MDLMAFQCHPVKVNITNNISLEYPITANVIMLFGLLTYTFNVLKVPEIIIYQDVDKGRNFILAHCKGR